VWLLAAAGGGNSSEGGNGAAGNSDEAQQDLRRLAHQTLAKVGEDFNAFKYNTLIAALMGLRNHMKSNRAALAGSPAWEEALDMLVLMMAPLTPYLSEELWQRRHPGPSVHTQPWPAFDAALASEDSVMLIIQINGKVRERMDIPANTAPGDLEGLAMAQPKVQEALSGKTVRKVIPVGNKLVNIVAN